MTLIASKTTEAPLWISEEDADGNETWLPGTATHPLATLLERPNPDQEMADLIEELVLFYLMGPTLLVLNRDRIGRVASMYAFDYAAFTVKPAWVRGEYRRNGVFTVTTAGGDRRDFGPDDVIYLRPPGGVGAVDAALTNIRLGADLRAAVKTSLRRAMRPGSVTTLDTTPDQQILEHFKQQLSQYEGATGKNMVLAGEGIEWKQVPVNLKDLDLGPLDDATEAAVCSAFKVPPEMVRAHVALKHNGGLADAIKPAQQLYYDQAQFPLWERIGRALTRGLLRPVDPDPLRYVRFVTDRIRALQPDLVANANTAKALSGIARLDEQRALVKLPPVGGVDGETIAVQGPQNDAPAAPAPRKAAGARRETKAVARPTTPEEVAAFWRAFDAKAAPRRASYEQTAKRLFREERAGVLATLRGAKAAVVARETKADDPTPEDRIRAALEGPYLDAAALQIAADYATEGPYAMAWADEFTALLTATMEGAAQEFTAGIGVTFSMDNPGLIHAIEQRAAALVQNVLQTTKDAITAAIAEGKAKGLTIEQIAALVDEQAFGKAAAARAQTIANTEVVGAINDAEWTAAQAADVFVSKRWIHARGPGAGRDQHEGHEHEGSDGGWVSMGYAYSWTDKTGNSGTMLRPFDAGLPASEVVNCGCAMAYSDVDPAQAREENPT
jgi:HK97 family phage portal protein